MTLEVDGRRKKGGDPMNRVKKAMERRGLCHIRIRVDNDEDADMISVFLSIRGFDVGVDSDGSTCYVEGLRSPAPEASLPCGDGGFPPEPPGTLVLISKAGIGPREDELAATLMNRYIQALALPECRPDTLLFIHEGVCLPFGDKTVRNAIDTLADGQVTLLFCQTSLDFYGLDAGNLPGKTVSMPALAKLLNRVERIIRF